MTPTASALLRATSSIVGQTAHGASSSALPTRMAARFCGRASSTLSTSDPRSSILDPRSSILAFNLNFASDNDVDVEGYGANGTYSNFTSDNLRFDVAAGVGRVDALGKEGHFVAIGAGF